MSPSSRSRSFESFTLHLDALDVNHKFFFRFTSERWLGDEQAQLQEPYVKFNVSALHEITVSIVEAKYCISMTRITRGGSNIVLRRSMDNSIFVIAHIPRMSA